MRRKRKENRRKWSKVKAEVTPLKMEKQWRIEHGLWDEVMVVIGEAADADQKLGLEGTDTYT